MKKSSQGRGNMAGAAARVLLAAKAVFLGAGLIASTAFANGTWTQIAIEGQSFSFSGTKDVRYGSGSTWVQKSVTGSGACTNAFFGSDPIPYVQKQCEVPNAAPTVSLYYPAAGSSFTAPATFSVKASAADTDGTVSKVEFYWNGQLKATVTAPPYILQVNNALIGSHEFVARAYDNYGVGTFSAPLNVSVVPSANNQPPTVALTSPTAGSTFSAPATINLAANASDAGGISRVDFYKNGVLLGSDSTAPYTFSWTGVPAGSYSFTAKAYDNEGLSNASTAVSVTVGSAPTNVAPTVSLTAPTAGANYTAPASVTITATAADSDGTVARVEFYNGTALLGTSTAAPYSYTWTSVAAGTYSLTARAFDNSGAQTTSAARSMTVNAVANVAPTVSLTAPTAGATYTAPASVTITAMAADSDGTVARVEFYNGATLLATSTAAPYSYTWANVAAGTYSVTARAFDNSGAQTTSAARSITVSPAANVAPTVNLTAPTAGATYTAPASVTITATAADSDGTVARVEFYNGATLLGTSTAAPYSYTWTNVVAGTYSLTARAVDNSGAQTSSTATSITVNPAANVAPTVSLTAPAAGATYTAPASVTITATAADSDGTVARVEFYNGATLIGTSTSAPYSYTWANVAAGTYSLTARAFDNSGAQTSSSAASITVGAAPVTPATTLYFIHSDHLNTPRAVTNQAGTDVWRWDQAEPFGLNAANADADGNGTQFEFNLRFAGQYYDRESGLHYNHYRDYDPTAGRYVQSDPIGLVAGPSLYAYVNGNPVSLVDPLGLIAQCRNDAHHPIPKYLGGDQAQQFSQLNQRTHRELHSLTRAELKSAGLPARPGTGSAASWADYFTANPGSQDKAMQAILNASRTLDTKYGTSVTQDIWSNLIKGSFTSFP